MAILASFIAACAALLGGLFNQPSVMQSMPPQAAMVQNIVLSVAKPAALITENLLPTVKVKLILPAPPVKKPSSTSSVPLAHPSQSLSKTTPTAATSSIIVTAQSFLAATTLTPVELRDGPYEVRLATAIGTGGNINWDLSQATVGGTSTPTFAVSYSCDPVPISPISGSPDQNPTFAARTPYTCTLSLTPQSGTDLRTQTRQFSFTTPGGQLIVTAPSAMSTILKGGVDNGGFVFDNEDTRPVTVAQMTLDISYTGLSTVYGPLVFRVVNPVTGQPAGDYHLENLPAKPGQQYTFAQSGIVIPVSITIPAGSQKLLPLQLLGVDTMSIQGVNPVVTVTLRGITTNPIDSNTVINGTQLSWSCVVTFAGYDPNATSGALVAGDACGVGGN